MAFNDNVFVNCPFDAAYQPLLRALLFTIVYLGLRPRIALELAESGESRITKIVELIESSKFAVHDLSRIKADKKGALYRLNMPFELGLDWGCRQFGSGRLRDKRMIVLEAGRFVYQAALSDIAGSDIAAHRNEPREILALVRDWLANQLRSPVSGSSGIWRAYAACMAQLHDDLPSRGFDPEDIENLPVPKLVAYCQAWVKAPRG